MVDHVAAGGVAAADLGAQCEEGFNDVLGTAGACKVQWREATEGAAFEEGGIGCSYVFDEFHVLRQALFRWRRHDYNMKEKFVYFC